MSTKTISSFVTQTKNFAKGLFTQGLRVDSQASRRTKCCESVITLVNVITNYFLNHFSQCNYSTQLRTLSRQPVRDSRQNLRPIHSIS